MKPIFEICGRKIGPNFKPLVIAELGINHSGSIVIAKQMVDAAVRAGVEVIKHQTHIVEDEMSKIAKNVIPGNSKISIYEIMEQCALSESDELELKRYIESKGLIFLSTPFSRAAVNRLIKFKVAAFKIGSGECNNYPLLDYIASFGKPIILSTGMNTIESVRDAVNTIKKHNVELALLHTTNIYPTPSNLVRLGAMQELMKEFDDLVIGLSDHTTNNLACFAAVAQGASILERHFTDHMNRLGPDISCSMDEKECKELIDGSIEIHQMLGGKKQPANEESLTIDFAYASVVSIKPIKQGEIFTRENIWVKRPGKGGILAKNYENILGKNAVQDIENDTQIQWDQISKQ